MTYILSLVAAFVAGMPWWVWAILVYLLFVGIDATRDRVIFVPKLFVIPTLLFWLKRTFFMTATPFMLTVYCVTLVMSGLLQYLFIKHIPATAIRGTYSVQIQGNYTTLILLMVFFWAKCIFGFLHSQYPDIAAKYIVYEVIINALIAGNFLGRASYYIQKLWESR